MDTLVENKTDIKTDLGFDEVVEDTYKLLLWNDEVNDMVSVMVALMDICGLTEQESFAIMMAAHNNGKAVAKVGDKKEIETMKKSFDMRNIETTVEN